jgi:uncharacterized membrane protein
MGIDITASTTIRAPRERVARFVIDPGNDVAWIGGISEARLEGTKPLGIGSRVRRVASFLGKRIEYVNRIEELEPESRVVMRSVESPVPMVVTYAFEDAPGGGTRTSVRVQGEPAAVYRIAGPLIARQVRHSVGDDLRRLKGLLETDDGQTQSSP